MAITWTPWFNVPMHRRMELFGIGFVMFCVLILPVLSSMFILYLLLAGNIYMKAITVVYLAFIYYDRNTGISGGRGAGVPWVRGWNIWKHAINYFPLDLVKTADLPSDRNYLICCFPHGILSLGVLMTCNVSHSKWSTLFPKIRSKCTTLSMNLILPITRELLFSLGACSVAASSLTKLMEQSNDPKDKSNQDGYTANAAALIVGGAQESFYALPNTYKCVLKNRKGFVRIALKTGASLVPAISFGENDLFEIIEYPPGSWRRFLQDTFKRYTKLAPIHFNGRGILQYNYGIVPKRQPVTTVIGAPIHLEKNPNPTQDEVNKTHDLFCAQLRELFETHKSKYVENSDKVELEII
ncbi:2-acylglycerol O-acyltransferase 2-like [Contarinia nasturtii]|uniref:2-acylglycerol O-acyltransferase 2-like n=1 Tax=Contarinia nasturtii TaxID=265458 RepID=UPI0012D48AE0|nr:2-acylglycerol O-acyltransferase 2-like [Contarinia nasturtii]